MGKKFKIGDRVIHDQMGPCIVTDIRYDDSVVIRSISYGDYFNNFLISAHYLSIDKEFYRNEKLNNILNI